MTARPAPAGRVISQDMKIIEMNRQMREGLGDKRGAGPQQDGLDPIAHRRQDLLGGGV